MRCTTPMATVLTAFYLIGTLGFQANAAEPKDNKTQSHLKFVLFETYGFLLFCGL